MLDQSGEGADRQGVAPAQARQILCGPSLPIWQPVAYVNVNGRAFSAASVGLNAGPQRLDAISGEDKGSGKGKR
jgi:hypothetical protein